MKQLIEHRLEVAEHNLEQYQDDPVRYWETEIRIQELKDILKELERVEIKPEPQPIENLFELDPNGDNIEIWVKLKNTHIIHAIYDPYRERIYLSGGMTLSRGEIEYSVESFLIAEVPKF
jgi:hypothetical protein